MPFAFFGTIVGQRRLAPQIRRNQRASGTAAALLTGGKPGCGTMWRRAVALPVAALAVATPVTALAVAVAPTAPAARTGIVITAFTDAGVNIGGGVPQEFDRTNASFSGTVNPRLINLVVTGGTAGKGSFWVFQVEPPPGSTFHVGYYPRVASAGSQAWGFAGLNISGSQGCGGLISGSVEVRDIATSGSRLTRLDLLYEQHCDGAAKGIFGEIRIGEPDTAGRIVSSDSITWPVAPGIGSGSNSPEVPVYVRNTGSTALHVGKVSRHGLAAADFRVMSDSCSGATIARGTSCAIELGFSASARGPRTAALRIPLGGRTYQVQLDALVRPGTTSLVMRSQPGDPVGNGGSFHFTTSNSYITANGTPFGISAAINGSAQTWGAAMSPP